MKIEIKGMNLNVLTTLDFNRYNEYPETIYICADETSLYMIDCRDECGDIVVTEFKKLGNLDDLQYDDSPVFKSIMMDDHIFKVIYAINIFLSNTILRKLKVLYRNGQFFYSEKNINVFTDETVHSSLVEL